MSMGTASSCQATDMPMIIRMTETWNSTPTADTYSRNHLSTRQFSCFRAISRRFTMVAWVRHWLLLFLRNGRVLCVCVWLSQEISVTINKSTTAVSSSTIIDYTSFTELKQKTGREPKGVEVHKEYTQHHQFMLTWSTHLLIQYCESVRCNRDGIMFAYLSHDVCTLQHQCLDTVYGPVLQFPTSIFRSSKYIGFHRKDIVAQRLNCHPPVNIIGTATE